VVADDKKLAVVVVVVVVVLVEGPLLTGLVAVSVVVWTDVSDGLEVEDATVIALRKTRW